MRSLALLCLLPLAAGAPGSYINVATSDFSYRTGRYDKQFGSLAINSGDMILDTRYLSNQVQATLRELAANTSTAEIVKRIIDDKDNICLGTIEEGIAGIESATKLVERACDDIKILIKKVKSFRALTDPATVVRSVADILRLVEPVVTKLAPESPVICEATPDQAFGSLRSLAALVDEISYTNQLVLTKGGRQQLKKSARTISAVTTFLTQLRETFSSMKEICTTDKEYNTQAISAVGDLVVNLADMFGALEGAKQGEQVRKGKEYVNKVVVSYIHTDSEKI